MGGIGCESERPHRAGFGTNKPTEQAELLRNVLLNCAIDGVDRYPSHRKLFDLIANGDKE